MFTPREFISKLEMRRGVLCKKSHISCFFFFYEIALLCLFRNKAPYVLEDYSLFICKRKLESSQFELHFAFLISQ